MEGDRQAGRSGVRTDFFAVLEADFFKDKSWQKGVGGKGRAPEFASLVRPLPGS